MELHGFSFHVGSLCTTAKVIRKGISICKKLIFITKSMGCDDIKLIDIGGGIPGDSDFMIDEVLIVYNYHNY